MKYELISTRHAKYLLHAYFVFTPKYRKKIFTKTHFELMSEVFIDVCNKFDAQLVEFDGEKDHVHLLIHYPPKISVSKLVNSLKGVSSRYLKTNFPELEKYYWGNALWSPSYFAGSCGGAPLEIIKEYIRSQETPN